MRLHAADLHVLLLADLQPVALACALPRAGALLIGVEQRAIDIEDDSLCIPGQDREPHDGLRRISRVDTDIIKACDICDDDRAWITSNVTSHRARPAMYVTRASTNRAVCKPADSVVVGVCLQQPPKSSVRHMSGSDITGRRSSRVRTTLALACAESPGPTACVCPSDTTSMRFGYDSLLCLTQISRSWTLQCRLSKLSVPTRAVPTSQ